MLRSKINLIKRIYLNRYEIEYYLVFKFLNVLSFSEKKTVAACGHFNE